MSKMIPAPLIRPFRSPYEPIAATLSDGEKFVFVPKLAKRLCLPADYATNVLRGFNQKWARQYGNPWHGGHENNWILPWSGMAQILINAGTSILLWNPAYSLSGTVINNYGVRAVLNWVHDKTNHKFEFQFILDNDLEETNPIQIYDDDETFWSAGAWGGGGVGTPTLSEELTQKVKGTSSLKIVVPSGTSGWSGASHVYTADQDWSTKESIGIYLYGANTGGTIRIQIQNADATMILLYDVTDNFTGWKRFVIPLRKFTVAAGTMNWATIREIRVMYQNIATFYLDRTVVDVEQWVKVEVYVPDALNPNGGTRAEYAEISSWDGLAWQKFLSIPCSSPDFWRNNALLYFLDGTNQNQIMGTSPNGMAGYDIGERETSKAPIGDSNAGNITYSSYRGCLKRIGFAIKMPPDDGQDSSTAGISQCKLKLEVYYDKVFSRSLWKDLWGLATYEFEKSTNQYYGLDNINDSWLALFDETSKTVEFLILSQRPLGLTVRADENEEVDQIEITLKKGTVIHVGQFIYSDLSRDTDADGVPDFLDEASLGIPVLVSKRDYKW